MIEETYLPQCLAMGIRAEDFWKLNIRKLRPFLKAEQIKFEQKNRECHLLGMYVYDAVAIAINNQFRKSGQAPASYPDKPYEFLTEKEIAERKRKAEIEKMKAQFMTFVEQTRKRLEKNGN